jgi:2-(1,2-epoxy-1,2-dihydrophenyl)acetyl-CoA isomerase
MENILMCEQFGHQAIITLNRPEVFNALNWDLMSAFAEKLVQISSDSEIWGVIITGNGPAFCAGGDLSWANHYEAGLGSAFHKLTTALNQIVNEIHNIPKPVIAAINGVAAGAGFAIALSCDFRVMAETARFKQGYTSAGLCIDAGGTYMLPRLVGLARALEIAAFDQPIHATTAHQWGLVTKLVEHGKALPKAQEMLDQMFTTSLHSYGWAKSLMYESFENSFETHIERERQGLSICAEHSDGREGITAFLEKRNPQFNH